MPPTVQRHALDVSAVDLQVAAGAIDSALAVSVAKEARKTGSRKGALSLLQGANVIAETGEGKRGSVVQKRPILTTNDVRGELPDVDASSTTAPVRKKHRSGASNWPKNRAERLTMEVGRSRRCRDLACAD